MVIELENSYYTRVEKVRVTEKHSLYKTIDKLSFKAKNIYNSALYIQRKHYFSDKRLLSYNALEKIHKQQCQQDYYSLPTKTSQQILKIAVQDFKSFKALSIKYNSNPKSLTGKPKIPNYKPKNGRFNIYFTNQQVKFKDESILFPKDTNIEPLKTKLKLQSIRDDLGFTNNPINQVRITPNSNSYTIEIVYTKTMSKPDTASLKYAAGLDLGIDNFAAITVFGPSIRPLLINGKGLKSYNKNFNKKLAKYKSLAMMRNNIHSTKRISNLYEKRNRFTLDFYHKASKATVNYLLKNKVKTLVVGYNQGWKQKTSLSKQVNQTFIQIAYKTYINQLEYKLQEVGIKLILQEESYTSGTSFIDDEQPTKANYDITRRKHRGLFESNSGFKINADINSAFQILKKVEPEVSYTKSRGLLRLSPTKLTINKCIVS